MDISISGLGLKEVLGVKEVTANPPLSARSYKITHTEQRESATLLFAHCIDTDKDVVIKILRPYHDQRYSLGTREERQECQIEALKWNKLFSPNVSIELGQVETLALQYRFGKQITLYNCIEKPEMVSLLSPDREWALIMEHLPESGQLDNLLRQVSKRDLYNHIRLLTDRIKQIHAALPSLSYDNAYRWGKVEQLREKLLGNLALTEPLLTHFKSILLRFYNPYQHSFNELQSSFEELRVQLKLAISHPQFHEYFEQRIIDGHIKRCHGDLKAPNIWIRNGEVCILDAIDFNPQFCNVDVLSDLAMLIVDIQVRTGFVGPANQMINDYLQCSKQNTEQAKAVLNYYLVEKAYIGAVINMLYDKEPELGCRYLKIAKMHMRNLSSRLKKTVTHPLHPPELDLHSKSGEEQFLLASKQ